MLGNRSENFVGSEGKTFNHDEDESDGFVEAEVDSEKGKCCSLCQK